MDDDTSIRNLEVTAIEMYKSAERFRNNQDTFQRKLHLYNTYLINSIINHPASMYYSWDSLSKKANVKVVTSDNKKLRFYTWDQEYKGSTRWYRGVVQIEDQSEIIAKEMETPEGLPGASVDKIYTLTAKDVTYYIVIKTLIASHRAYAHRAVTYIIKNKRLEPINLFWRNKESYQERTVSFDFYLANEKRNGEPIEMIHYNPEKKQFKFAETDGSGNEIGKFMVYEWQNDHFEFIAVQ